MLKEIKNIKQIKDEPFRRWFYSDYFDLIIWFNKKQGNIIGFQLCYNKNVNEHAIYWSIENGFKHYKVDQGDDHSLKNLSPILLDDGVCPIQEIIQRFKEDSIYLDKKIYRFIINKLELIEHKDGYINKTI